MPSPSTMHSRNHNLRISKNLTDKKTPGGLQSTSGAVGDVLGNSYDMRGGQSKKSDEAGKAIGEMGKGEKSFLVCHMMTILILCNSGKGSTVPGTSINADTQTQNQNTGTADHLDLGFRKQT